jgi:hypothetical protein
MFRCAFRVAFANDFLVLRQYGLLEHVPCLSVDRKGIGRAAFPSPQTYLRWGFLVLS